MLPRLQPSPKQPPAWNHRRFILIGGCDETYERQRWIAMFRQSANLWVVVIALALSVGQTTKRR